MAGPGSTVAGERVARASLIVQARLHDRWQRRTRRRWTGHRYSERAGRPLALDLYVPRNRPGPHPLIVWFHGGGWQDGTRADVAPLAMAQVGRGWALASVGYSLAPGAQWPTQAHETKAAVRWLRSNAGTLDLDPGRFVAWGLSSGAHLASIVGLTPGDLEGELEPVVGSSEVQGVIAWYGPSDLTAMGRNSVIDHESPDSAEAALLGGPVTEQADLARSASPVHHVSGSHHPPFLLVHGTADPIVPHSQSEALHRSLERAGGRSELVSLRFATHVDLRCNTGRARRAALRFLDRLA